MLRRSSRSCNAPAAQAGVFRVTHPAKSTRSTSCPTGICIWQRRPANQVSRFSSARRSLSSRHARLRHESAFGNSSSTSSSEAGALDLGSSSYSYSYSIVRRGVGVRVGVGGGWATKHRRCPAHTDTASPSPWRSCRTPPTGSESGAGACTPRCPRRPA
jgi:hypothetical protein